MMNATIKDVAAQLVATKPLDTCCRVVRDVSMESMPVTLEIGQLLALAQSRDLRRNIVQRDDAARREAGRAEHVRVLRAAHLDIVVAYWQGAFHLVDGCHRVGHWLEDRNAVLPSHVTVLLKMPRTEEEYLELYNSYDSKKTTKTRADILFGYLRYLGIEDQVTSALLRRGQWATAFNVLHKSLPHRDELDTMRAYREAILKLDAVNLKEYGIPQGFVLAGLRLFHFLDCDTHVTGYLRSLSTAYASGGAGVTGALAKALSQLKLASQGHSWLNKEYPTTRLAQVIEEGFTDYCVEQAGKPVSDFVKGTPALAAPTAHGAVFA